MLAVTLIYGFEERLFSFAELSRHNSERQCKLDEAMYDYTFCQPLVGCKTIKEYLNFARDERGLLTGEGIILPKLSDTQSSAMRQGNLRSDGMI